jgi:hypothetical protein
MNLTRYSGNRMEYAVGPKLLRSWLPELYELRTLRFEFTVPFRKERFLLRPRLFH